MSRKRKTPAKKTSPKKTLIEPSSSSARLTTRHDFDRAKADNILLVLRQTTESHESALQWARVPWRTFRHWLRHDEDFRISVAAAEAHARINRSQNKDWAGLRRLDRQRPPTPLFMLGVPPKIAEERETRLAILRRLGKLRGMFPTARTNPTDVGGQRTVWTLEKTAVAAHYFARAPVFNRACLAAGVHADVARNWMRVGREETAKPEPDAELPALQFFVALSEARIECESQHVDVVTNAGLGGQWKASAWLLEHNVYLRPDWTPPPKIVSVPPAASSFIDAIAAHAAALPDDALDDTLARYERVLALTERGDGSYA